MVKTQSDTCQFDHPWSITVEGAFNKYPNEFQPNVKSLDILDRRINENGELVTEKLLRSKFIPNILMRKSMAALGMPVLTTQENLEISTLNLDEKRYTMTTCNNTYLTYMKVHETLVYTCGSKMGSDKLSDVVDSEALAKEATILTQTTSCDMYAPLYPWLLQWAVNLGEKAVISEVKSNIPKGRSAMNAVIPNLIKEFENFAQMTERVVKQNFDSAESLIKTCGQESIQAFEKLQEEVRDVVGKMALSSSLKLEEHVQNAPNLLPIARKRLISEGSLQQIGLETEKLINEVMVKAKNEILSLLKNLNELINEINKFNSLKTYQDSLKFKNEVDQKLVAIIRNSINDIEEISKKGVDKLKLVDPIMAKMTKECNQGISSSVESVGDCILKLTDHKMAQLRKSLDNFEQGINKNALTLHSD